MKIILDECVPRRFKASLIGHECSTVPESGLAGKRNGELLALIEPLGFEAFVTLDKGIQYQQNLRDRKIIVLVIRARTNRLIDLLPYANACLAALVEATSGDVIVIG